MIRIAVVGAIRLYREGLEAVVGQSRRLELVGTARSRRDGLRLVAVKRPDSVLVDMAMPEGLELISDLALLQDPLEVLALGVREGDVVACAEAGATGFVSRESGLDEVVGALERARRGELECSPRVSRRLFGRIHSLASQARLAAPAPGIAAYRLTPRQDEIVRLIELGLSNKEIASRLLIEESTVKNHVHAILDKMQVRRRGEAAARYRADFPRA